MFEKNIEIEQMFVYNKTRSEGCTYGIQRTYNRNARSCERETIKADLHPCKSIIKAEMTQPFFIWIESRNFSKTFHPFSSNVNTLRKSLQTTLASPWIIYVTLKLVNSQTKFHR